MTDAHNAAVLAKVRRKSSGSLSAARSSSGSTAASVTSRSTTSTTHRSSWRSSTRRRASLGGCPRACEKGDPFQWSHEVVDAMATRRSGYGWNVVPARDGTFGCMKHFLCNQHMLCGDNGEEKITPCEEFPECRACSVCADHDERARKVREKRKAMGRGLHEDWRVYIIGLPEVRDQRPARPPYLNAADNRALRVLKSLRSAAEQVESHGGDTFTMRDFYHTLFVSSVGSLLSMTMMKKMYRKWCKPTCGEGRQRSHDNGVFLHAPERKNNLSTAQVIQISTLLILNLEHQAVHGLPFDGAAAPHNAR